MRIASNNANSEIIFPELSYEVVGASFEVFNKLGRERSEKVYQSALAYELEIRNVPFTREVHIPTRYKDSKIGTYFADFIIRLYALSRQVLSYLRSANSKLGILFYFTKDGVKYRRILNSKV